VEKGLKVLGATIDEHYWSDVGTISQYRVSNFDALDGRVKLNLQGRPQAFGYTEEGSSISPEAKVEGRLYLGRNSVIDPAVRIKGYALIGDNCRIEAGAQLENTIVWSNTTIQREAILTNSVVGSNCTVQAGSTQNEIAYAQSSVLS
jgi:mannose-1-phosphate guanylyltransferase/phosphomannomutase